MRLAVLRINHLHQKYLMLFLFRLAAKHGLKLVMKERFLDYFQRVKDSGRQLLGRMQAFEVSDLIFRKVVKISYL